MKLIINVLIAVLLIFSLSACDHDSVKSTSKRQQPVFKVKDHSTIDFIGSSVINGVGSTNPTLSMVGRLNVYFQKNNKFVKVNNYGVSGYSTADILNKGVLNKVINDNPALVIFEDCLINDFYQKIPVQTSKQNVKTAIILLEKAIPNARIIVIPPNETVSFNTSKPVSNLSYANYVNNVGEFLSNEVDIRYINYWPKFDKQLKENNLTLNDVLINDGIHPNDVGYGFWFEALKSYFKVK